MIEELIQLEPQSMLSIDDERSKQFTGLEDFIIVAIENINCESAQVVIVDLNDFILISSNLSGEIKYAICELYDDGYEYLDDNEEDFSETIELIGGEGNQIYQQTYIGFSIDHVEDSFCEYTTDDHFDFILIRKQEHSVMVYRGFELAEMALVL